MESLCAGATQEHFYGSKGYLKMSDDTERAMDLYHQAIWKHFGDEPNLQAAVSLYRESADLGFGPAQNNLGYCYERGISPTSIRMSESDQPAIRA